MQGEVSEWSNEADSKSVIQLVVSGVQIPSSPPKIGHVFVAFFIDLQVDLILFSWQP